MAESVKTYDEFAFGFSCSRTDLPVVLKGLAGQFLKR
jgi:hypothetical protein